MFYFGSASIAPGWKLCQGLSWRFSCTSVSDMHTGHIQPFQSSEKPWALIYTQKVTDVTAWRVWESPLRWVGHVAQCNFSNTAAVGDSIYRIWSLYDPFLSRFHQCSQSLHRWCWRKHYCVLPLASIQRPFVTLSFHFQACCYLKSSFSCSPPEENCSGGKLINKGKDESAEQRVMEDEQLKLYYPH